MASPDMPPPPQETFTFKRLFTYDTDHPDHATLLASALAAKIPGLVGGDPSLRLRLMTEAGQQPGAAISSSTVYYYEIIGEPNN